MQRRTLDFRSLSQVVDDARRLQENGCQAVGNWDLAQVCRHLADALNASIDGFDVQAPWILRVLFGKAFFRKIRARRSMKAGFQLPEKYVPRPGQNPSEALASLEAAVERFGRRQGPLFPHPFFGKLSPEEWTDLHLIHAAHHLSFLVPAGQAQPAASPAGLA